MIALIVGGGQVGSYLANRLLGRGDTVRLVEIRDEAKPALHGKLPPGVMLIGNGTEPALLESAGVRHADVVAAVTGDDETNLVITSLARFEFHARRTIARVNNPKNAWMFTPEMGVDVAINQADLIAHLIEEEMSLGDMMTLLKLRRGQFSLVEEQVHPEARAAHCPVAELHLPADCTLVAIIREGALLAPHSQETLRPGDEVLALVRASQAPLLAAALGPPPAEAVPDGA